MDVNENKEKVNNPQCPPLVQEEKKSGFFQGEENVGRILLVVAIAVAALGLILAVGNAFTYGDWAQTWEDGEEAAPYSGEFYFEWRFFFRTLSISAVISALLLGFRELIYIKARQCREITAIRKALEKKMEE